MFSPISKLSHYYKNVLEHCDLKEVRVLLDASGKYPQGGYPVGAAALLAGEIDKTTLAKLFHNVEENRLEITIVLDAFKYAKDFRASMCILAVLKRDGHLNISEFPNFNICKNYLEPFADAISVGSSWEEFLTIQKQYSLGNIEEWSIYIETIFAIKNALIKKIEIELWGKKREIKDRKHYIFKGNLIAHINANILSLYQESSQNKIASILSKKIADIALKAKQKYQKKRKNQIKLTSNFSGAFPKSKFIPNFQQWKIIETVLDAKKGQSIAVQGPPGTGKTSLFQFLIASEIVNSVRKGEDRPTLTAICSTNNRAVINALESLHLKAEHRWLPTEMGLGVYIAFNPKASSLPNLIINKSFKNGKFYINSEYFDPFFHREKFLQIKQNFIESASQNLSLKWPVTLDRIASYLKQRVETCHRKMKHSHYKLKIHAILKYGPFGIFVHKDEYYYHFLKDHYWKKHLTIMEDAFVYALHYWEALFLKGLEAEFNRQGKNKKLSFKSPLEAIKTISMLTPFISLTLHQLAKYMGTVNRREKISESIGLLILDEAGQICPEISFFSLIFAQKALIVGDIMQLPPIHTISDKEAARFETAFPLADAFKSSKGNCMASASATADYETCLLEHYRCHPDIIAISNELCYENKLIIQKSDKSSLYSPLCFLDIYGLCQKDLSGSLQNNDECHAIVTWILHEKKKIESYYKRKISELLAIATPFKKQAAILQSNLEKHGIKELIVGTVHKLQGGEFPIIIFSPTYTIEYVRTFLEPKGQKMFFDICPSMINVVVSRAQHSFIYMGDPRILNYGNDNERLPSQILAKHLHAKATELAHISKENDLAKIQAVIERISSLQAHQKLLDQVFNDAQDRIVISSPFITSTAILKDDIVIKIVCASRRGVKVKIFYDKNLNRGRMKDLQKGIELLLEAGAEVIHKEKLHSKVLYIDNKMIVESSFNWLSAIRDVTSPYQRYESSLIYRGERAAKMISDVEKELT